MSFTHPLDWQNMSREQILEAFPSKILKLKLDTEFPDPSYITRASSGGKHYNYGDAEIKFSLDDSMRLILEYRNISDYGYVWFTYQYINSYKTEWKCV